VSFAIDAPAQPMVVGARQLPQNPQYIGAISIIFHVQKSPIHTVSMSCATSLYILYFERNSLILIVA